MYTSLLPAAISLLSVSPFVSYVTASAAVHLPHVPRQIDLAPRASSDLNPRHPLKQVTRQQLLERHAKAKLLKARGPQAPPPQQSPIPPTTGKFVSSRPCPFTSLLLTFSSQFISFVPPHLT